MAKYYKKGTVVAVQINLDLKDGVFKFEKWGDTQTAKKGDWLINNNGEIYTCDNKVFQDTYREATKGNYYKFSTIEAVEATEDCQIKTLEGISHCKKGDFIVTNIGGDQYFIEREKFFNMYEEI